MTPSGVGTNWAGNVRYRARRLHEPTSIDEVRRLLPRLERARILGSRHSFNGIADTDGDLVSLRAMPRTISIDGARSRVTVDGGARYGDICAPLDRAGWALHALASLPHISVAGAVATATHGSGDEVASLAGAVVGLELVTASGDLVTIDGTSEPDLLHGATVSLGALGAVVRVTLAIEPSYAMRQDVFEGLSVEDFVDRFEAVSAGCDSASWFTTFRPDVGFHQVWLKRRVRGPAGHGVGDAPAATDAPSLPGATRAQRPLHPIPGKSAEACTAQLGVPGPWHERAPHFRLDHTPSSGAELQTEYYVARADVPAAVTALFGLGDRIAPYIQASEVRTVATEELWLSPAYLRASGTIHITWVPDWEQVRRLLPDIEAALAPFAPRPHWAKLSTMSGDDIGAAYERLPDLVQLARRFDPAGVFRNDFLDGILG